MVEKIKSALHGEHGMKSATILLVITLFLSNVLGLVRNIVLASHAHGLGQLDSYYAAFRLPDLIFNILILGAISSAFIPVYTKTLKESGNEEAQKLANTLLGTLLTLVLVGIVIIWVAAPLFIPLLVHNFNASKQLETVYLTRILLLSPLFFTLSYVAGGVLNAHKRFLSYSIAPLIYNCAIIVGGFLLPRYGVAGVAWSVVVGAALHFFIQVPTLCSMHFRIRPRFIFSDPAVLRVVMLTLPRTFSLAMGQLSLLAFTVIASALRPGALTIFALANDLQTTPAIIFGASLATAVFPTLSTSVAEQSHHEFHRYLHRTMRLSIFTVVPLMLFTYLLRAQIMRLYIGLGHTVSWTETIRSIQTLGWFTFSFVAQAFVFILARAFYALQDTKRPMYASLIATFVTIVLAILLPYTGYFSETRNDVAALAAAYSVGMWLQAVLLYVWLPPVWRGSFGAVFASLQKTVVITIVAGLAMWFVLRLVGEGLKPDHVFDIGFRGIGTDTVLKLLIQSLFAASVGVGVYVGLASYYGMEELRWVLQARKARYDQKTDQT